MSTEIADSDIASALESALGKALGNAGVLECVLGMGGRGRVLSFSRGRSASVDLSSGIDIASDLARLLSGAIAIDIAEALDRARGIADDADFVIANGATRMSVRLHARERLRELIRDMAHARQRAREADGNHTHHSPEVTSSDKRRQRGQVGMAWSASQLVSVAAQLLPTPDRARYDEEFRGELWDLAEAGAGRKRQIGYAGRQLTRAPRLRIELKNPRQRKASP